MLFLRNGTRDQHRFAAGVLDPLLGFSRIVFFLGQVRDADVRTLACECDGYRTANA
jgi:hypothetical protein